MTGAAPTVNLPFPHPGQQYVREHAKRFNWVAAGRRWRKTTMAMTVAVEAALVRHKRFIWGAPVYDQVRVGWEETKRAAINVADFNFSRMTATFPGGGAIIYRSLDNPNNVRGHTADGVVVDEVADVSPDAWYEVLRPMLIDTEGEAWIWGTPKGVNWFANEHAKAPDSEDSASFHAPTLGVEITPQGLIRRPHPLENPNIPFEEITNLYETMPEATFRQEILAEFLQSEGAVFRNIVPNLTAPENADPMAHREHRIVSGLDWGQKHDFTAHSIGCADCKVELELDRFNKIEWAFQRGRVVEKCRKWGISQILAEHNSIGGPNIEALQAEGLPVVSFETTAQSKGPLIQSLALALERMEYQWLNMPAATSELVAYESKVSAITGRVSYSAPEGMHDDTVIARALMLKSVLDRGVTLLDDDLAQTISNYRGR